MIRGEEGVLGGVDLRIVFGDWASREAFIPIQNLVYHFMAGLDNNLRIKK